MSLRPSALLLVWAATAMLVLGPIEAARAATPGSLDSSFGGSGIVATGSDSRLFGTVVLANGEVVGVGEAGAQSSAATLVMVQYTTSGSLDHSFGAGGVVRGPAIVGSQDANSLGRSVAVQPDGKLVVVGSATDPTGTYDDGLIVERYNANGSVDTSFGSGGVVTLLAGQSYGEGYAVAIQPDGKIIATGSADAAGSGGTTPRVAVVRLNANGSLDSSFGAGGIDVLDLGTYSDALGVALQPTGKIVIVGSAAPGVQGQSALVAQLTAAGALDTSFASGAGYYVHQYAHGASNSAFNAVAIRGDGRIVAAGSAASDNSGADTLLVRFASSGALDGTFGSGGVFYTPSAVNWSFGATQAVPGADGAVLAPSGDIIVAGTYANSATTYATLWAVTAAGLLDGRFGHSGAAVLTNSDNYSTEYAAIALSPTSGDFVAGGDTLPFGGAYTGIAGRYIGFGTPPPPPLKLSVRGIRGSYKTWTVARHGLTLSIGATAPCTIEVSLTISAATARKLHLKAGGRNPVRIANAQATLKGPETKSITLKLSKPDGKALEKQKRVSLKLVISAIATGTNKTQTTSRGVTFRR